MTSRYPASSLPLPLSLKINFCGMLSLLLYFKEKRFLRLIIHFCFLNTQKVFNPTLVRATSPFTLLDLNSSQETEEHRWMGKWKDKKGQNLGLQLNEWSSFLLFPFYIGKGMTSAYSSKCGDKNFPELMNEIAGTTYTSFLFLHTPPHLSLYSLLPYIQFFISN